MKRLTLVLVVAATVVLPAQEPAFDVASVKVVISPGGGGFVPRRPGIVQMVGSLTGILPRAFGVPPELAGETFDYGRFKGEFVGRRYFEINAKGDPKNDSKAMLRTLLKERFGLKWHTETRTVPIYALKTGNRFGPGIKPSTVNCRTPADSTSQTVRAECAYRAGTNASIRRRSAGPMSDLALMLNEFSDRPVVDATGLKGTYAWDFSHYWGMNNNSLAERNGVQTLPDAVDEQLGLKLEQTRGPWEVIVIDDLRMPTPN